MKKLPHSFLSLTLALVLAACGGGAAPPDTSGGTTPAPTNPAPTTPTPATPATATLTITVTGVASAPVKVTDSTGAVKFDGTVSGSKALPGLTFGAYTVTAGAVADYAAPAAVSADLSKGDGGAALTYTVLPGQGLSSSQITGTLPGWTFGPADVYFERGSQPTVKGQVDKGGAVQLPIPAAISDMALGSFLGNCTFNGVATNLNVQAGAYSDYRTYAQSGDLLGVVQEQLISNSHDVWHIYSADDASFDGALHCDTTTTTIKLDLKKGWNYAEYAPAPTGQTSGAVLTTLAADARTQLAFIPAKPGVYMVLDTPTLNLQAGAQVTRQAMVYQTGNYSGTVNLSTTVPGLSVSPATLALAPLGTLAVKPTGSVHLDRVVSQQGLARQSVSTTLTFSAGADAQVHVADAADALVATDPAGTTVGSTPLKVNLSAPTVTAYASDASLSRGQTTKLNVQLTSQNQYAGPVQVSLEGLPAGVTASTGQATFVGTYPYQNATLSVSTASDAAIGATKATLAVNAGGRITRTPITLTVQQPAVQAVFSNNADSMHQGESKLVAVSVSSVNGFSGATTLSLSGLPAGVSAAPLTVTVTPGTTTTANFNLVSTTSAALGAATLSIVDTDLPSPQNSYSYSTSYQLSVRPQLIALISSGSQIASAHDGIWVLGPATYNQSTYTYQQTLTRYTGAGSAVSVSTSPGYYGSGSLVSTPSGDAVVVGGNGTTITRYQDDGSVKSTVNAAQSVTTYSSNSFGRLVADDQGGLWSVGYDSANNGGYNVYKTDLSSGQRSAVLGLSNSNASLFRDAAGTSLYVSGATGGVINKINFSTLARTDLTLPGISQAQALAVAQDGTLWGASSSYYNAGALFRLNADGTVNSFSSGASKIAFDPAVPTTLWLTGSSLTKYDTAAGTSTVIVDSAVQDMTTDALGGVWLETSENNRYGLSLVK